MKHLLILVLAIYPALAWCADFLAQLPATSSIVSGYESEDSLCERMTALPLCPVEGIWQMSADGAVFAIERAEPSTAHAPANLRMVMLRSPWRSIRPGTVFGHVVPTAKPGVYEARIYSSFAQRSGLAIPRRFTIDVKSDILILKPFKSPVKINLFRLLPYMYRRVITPQQSRPEGLDGAVKLFPSSAGHPLTPIYL